MDKKYLLLSLVLVAFWVTGTLNALPPAYDEPATVSVEAEAGFHKSLGVCNPILGDTDIDLWTFLDVNVEIDPEFIAGIRYIKITNMDLPASNATTLTTGVVGVMIGDTLSVNAYFDPIPLGTSMQFQIQRPRDCGLKCGNTLYPYPNGGPVPVTLYANGDDRNICVVAYN